jgi:dual 3',5'-cyclic-AMP and -GMP phosphodiesterase 11
MRKDSTNILKGLSKSVASELRKIILTCVLATDMTEHFGLVDKTKRIIAGGDYSFNETEDKMFLCTLLVHSADLSNPTRPFHITQVTFTEIIHIIHVFAFMNLYEHTFLFIR